MRTCLCSLASPRMRMPRSSAYLCVCFAAPLDTDKDPYGFRETGWPPERVPNPSTPAGAKQCGRSVECQHCCKVRGNDACRECSFLCCRHTVVRGSAICDPDGILAPETANKLEELIDAARKDISIPIAAFGLRYAPTLCPPLQIALFRAHALAPCTQTHTLKNRSVKPRRRTASGADSGPGDQQDGCGTWGAAPLIG